MSDNENRLAVYEDAAIRHNAAYAAFRSIYETKNPPPIKPEDEKDHVSTIIILALVVVMVASVVVSSSRTVQEFGGDAIGAVAFVMLEGGLVAYSFFRARRYAGDSRIENSRRLATLGLGLAFISAIGANVDSVLSTHGVIIPQAVNTGINLLVAISAPVLAFISADVLALELMAGDHKRRRAITLYNEQLKEWSVGLNRSWSAQQGNWGVKVEVEKPKELPASSASNVSIGQAGQSGQKRSKASSASNRVREHLDSTPEDVTLSIRELSEKIGVGKSTVATVIKEYVSVE